jgi:opacity protein-like surface antigen
MQKLFLTMAVAFSTLIASAQFTVVTSYVAPEDGAEWEMSSLTDNLGIGYSLNGGQYIVGLVKAGTDSLDEATYDLWGRYNLKNSLYVSVQAPIEEMMDNLTVGIGYSYAAWKGLCIEPNYSMGLKEDGEREGSFNIGLSYKF